ncbi:LysR family transcriptional regulator [Streptomyces badius]
MRAALLAVPAEGAAWSVPLGLAGARDAGVRRIYVETLRLGRGAPGPGPPRLDPAGGRRTAHPRPPDTAPGRGGPVAAQVLAAPDLTAAAAEVLCSDDLLLCSRAQAAELALAWRPIGELTPRRGYALTVVADGNPLPMEARLGEAITRCLGADDPAGAGGGKAA